MDSFNSIDDLAGVDNPQASGKEVLLSEQEEELLYRLVGYTQVVTDFGEKYVVYMKKTNIGADPIINRMDLSQDFPNHFPDFLYTSLQQKGIIKEINTSVVYLTEGGYYYNFKEHRLGKKPTPGEKSSKK